MPAAADRSGPARRGSVLLACQPSTGGVARHVRDLSAGLELRGWDVTVACPYAGALATELRDRGTSIIDLPMGREISASDYAAYRALLSACRRLSPDVIHAHSSKAGFIGRIAGRRAGVPAVLFTPHCWSIQSATGRKRSAYVALERYASRSCDMTIAVSQAEADEAVALGVLSAERIRVIHNGLAPAELAVTRPAEDALRDFTFVAVGRLDEQKGYPYLIDAMPAVIRAVPEATLAIVGGGPLLGELRARAQRLGVAHAVSFEGDRSDVADYLRRSQIFVLSSLWEGLPYAIMEAMAAGLPAIVTDVGGDAELVTDGVDGLVVAPRSPDALASAMIALASDPARAREMGDAGALIVRKRFRLESCIEQVERTYMECLGRR